ncbi:ferritin-like protein [Opisthorchis viverrini]|uniref:Ferritin n=1 Tax=Opisthorchis viverrini TaxID=6198 RepID=A0A1S8X4K2_OPIVI|nr:ferritin-like protein [Opisthorchis viverrini]
MSASLARQFFHVECEAGINKQINMELHASYVYMAMAHHFSRDDVALPGFHKFFMKQSDEEREHAQKLMKYQNMRGGRIVLQNIAPPETTSWTSGLEAMEAALELEKSVNKSLLELHAVSGTHGDPQFADFLEGEFLKEQVESIKQISDYVTNLRRCGPGLGEYLFDKETLHGEED